MMKLNSDNNKNRFCFFLKEGNKLLCFRYIGLIFRFNASSFVLLYALRHHAEQFQDGPCTQILENNFYTDKLCKTSNSPEELHNLYLEAVNLLEKSGFDLRSCNLIYELLESQMERDSRIFQHGSDLENVLCYKYKTFLQIPNMKVDTKRALLSQTASVFNPLSLCIPVTVRAKVLLRELWPRKLSWNDRIPATLQES